MRWRGSFFVPGRLHGCEKKIIYAVRMTGGVCLSHCMPGVSAGFVSDRGLHTGKNSCQAAICV